MVINRVYIIYTVYYIILYIYIPFSSKPMCCGSFVAARFVHRSPGLELFGGWGGIICESSPPQELMRAAGLQLDSGDRGAHGGEFELNFFSFMLTTCLQSCCWITVWNWSVESVGFFVVVSNMFFWEWWSHVSDYRSDQRLKPTMFFTLDVHHYPPFVFSNDFERSWNVWLGIVSRMVESQLDL